jgi:ABC-type nitrate/sulfonate/bicarbonate transport system ATPase subunit
MDTAATYTLAEDLLVVENLTVAYGNKTIIRDIGTAQIPFVIKDIQRANMQQGQTVAVLGRSGRGKSTFFKAITGIVQPNMGTIKIPDDKKQGNFRIVKEGDVGFVQQNFPLSRNQTIYQMLQNAAAQGQIAAGERNSIIDNHIENWGLKEQRNLAPNQLSGGQKQRVAIIEQLLCSHHFMVFDEPFSGLDVCNIEDVMDSFRKITTSKEINTIIFSTHDIDLAVGLADQIYIIGYEQNTSGQFIPGGTLVGYYDLKKLNLAWQQEFSAGHRDLVDMIKKQFKFS